MPETLSCHFSTGRQGDSAPDITYLTVGRFQGEPISLGRGQLSLRIGQRTRFCLFFPSLLRTTVQRLRFEACQQRYRQRCAVADGQHQQLLTADIDRAHGFGSTEQHARIYNALLYFIYSASTFTERPTCGDPRTSSSRVRLDLAKLHSQLPGPGDTLRMSKLSEYIRAAGAAKYLGVSQNTLRKWADTGVIPCRTLPACGHRLFREADLKKFVREVARPVRPGT